MEKVYFIVNKSSKTGYGAEIWKEIEKYLKEHSIEYEAFFTKKVSHATVLMRDLCKSKDHITVGVMGGDGTLNEAIQGITDFSKVELVYLPTGSGNDFARGIGLTGSTEDILKRAFIDGKTKNVDIGEVEFSDGVKKRFAVSSGAGVDAYVCYQALDSKLKRFLNLFKLGHLTYSLLSVFDLFSMPLCEAKVTVDGQEMTYKNAIFIAAMNGPFEGGGVPMSPNAVMDDGKLSAMIVSDIARLKCFFMLPKLLKAKHVGLKGFNGVDFEKMHVKLEKPMYVHTDGEVCGLKDELTFTCLKGVLKVRGV